MTFDELATAMNEAEVTLRRADSAAYRLASMLRGRLRRVDSKYVLATLKRELQDFNSQTGQWKS